MGFRPLWGGGALNTPTMKKKGLLLSENHYHLGFSNKKLFRENTIFFSLLFMENITCTKKFIKGGLHFLPRKYRLISPFNSPTLPYLSTKYDSRKYTSFSTFLW